mmetsp:Transcript_27317/g.56963  ORF Transcript_27317/g.56963 Transcript_27317/m.56963 type:complete len:99 (+) Transcript_27317:260-556(+)|eukprot:CAMPEP_0196219618 /NCGR_PEP_ID=MMETSP0912-20130531/39210_1 /TAXON_ID=49265 /ORGANISM="Thalassiosira rotula, Strain GSO102" /LENGTH=98 /DNA_ID=CAMNT_0041497643 /DNA_START=179 /DNA_END=475 /DNA_ORIENTATION=+
MASTLSEWNTKPITVLTCDGRLISGILQGYDQLQNLILVKSYEKVYSLDNPMERVDLGLFVVRGDNVAVIADSNDGDGDGDVEEDVRAEPVKAIYGNR